MRYCKVTQIEQIRRNWKAKECQEWQQAAAALAAVAANVRFSDFPSKE